MGSQLCKIRLKKCVSIEISYGNFRFRKKKPLLFEDFFELGLQETFSPFLTPSSRGWGANLTLKAAIGAAILLAISFGLKFLDGMAPLSQLLLIFVYFLAGIPALIESIEDLASFEINIDILMTLAAFSSVMIGSSTEGALLLVLFAISGSMEDAVSSKAKRAISSLHKLSPSKACVVDDGGILREKSVKDIAVGTNILVKAGEIVPLDGVVIAGASSVNLVHLTGENMPVTKTIGDHVPSGGQNLEGVLTLSVINDSGKSTVAKIIQLVTQAQEARPKLQRWFDTLSQTYAMSIIALAFIFALTLPHFISIPYLGREGSVYRALAFLIAASPCALIIAIPIAYLSALSVCAKRGILLKGGIVLDALASCKAFAFDKTGTLTLGELQCQGIEKISPNNSDHKSLGDSKLPLAIAAALEKNAVHPIAKALTSYCSEIENLPKIELEEFKSIPGYGLQAKALLPQGPSSVFIGNPEYILKQLSSEEKERSQLLAAIENVNSKGLLSTLLLIEKEIFLFYFIDTIRPKMKETIEAIRSRGLDVLMLTGDRENSAKKIASGVGIENIFAALTPEDKLAHIFELSETKRLAMVGDGVNDAPALARATVGICMGKVGSTSAIEAADVILLHDNIEMLDWLLGKASQTTAIVRQNLFLASFAIIFASLPALSGLLPLWIAVILHEGGTILVGLNALRLLKQ